MESMESRGIYRSPLESYGVNKESTGIPYIPVDSMKVLPWNSVEFHGFHQDSTVIY